MVYKSKEGAQAIFEDDSDKCLGIINKYWLLKGRLGIFKIPKKLHRIDFKEEFGDLITLLNRVMGTSQASQFENWMFNFMEAVSTGVEKIN